LICRKKREIKILGENPQNKSSEGQIAVKKEWMEAIFDFIRTEMDL
jgi:hypothetical protein